MGTANFHWEGVQLEFRNSKFLLPFCYCVWFAKEGRRANWEGELCWCCELREEVTVRWRAWLIEGIETVKRAKALSW